MLQPDPIVEIAREALKGDGWGRVSKVLATWIVQHHAIVEAAKAQNAAHGDGPCTCADMGVCEAVRAASRAKEQGDERR